MKHMQTAALLAMAAASWCAMADVQVIDGKKYECRDGVCMLVEEPAATNAAETAGTTGEAAPRIAQGYMPAEQFIAFLEGRDATSPLEDAGIWVTLLLALLGGLAMNLTPCVLPMIPINLIVIGRSARRGVAYGLGIAVAYGLLGVGAAVGGMAFGDIQGSPWFNAAVAVVFVGLALALLDVWFVDLSRFRKAGRTTGKLGGLAAFGMGAMSAALAGACVAPVLISVLLLTADLVAKGNRLAVGLPFVMGLGMALPWPFAGAGMRVLPKPGAWMKWVNRIFGAVVLGFAVHYGTLAVRGWTGTGRATGAGRTDIQVRDLAKAMAEAKRPVLIDCWATWCKNCAAMERVMEDEKVRKAMEGFEVIRVQAEDISDLRQVKGFESIRGLPAFVIFGHGADEEDEF